MEAHDIRTALSRLSEPGTSGTEARAAFARLDTFNHGGLFLGRFSGRTPWERHLHGDELLHILDGEVDITVLTEGDPVHATLRAGSVFIVPQGLWHRQLARVPVTVLTATPTPTDHSDAEDPRSGA